MPDEDDKELSTAEYAMYLSKVTGAPTTLEFDRQVFDELFLYATRASDEGRYYEFIGEGWEVRMTTK